jgi:hypothetical protein
MSKTHRFIPFLGATLAGVAALLPSNSARAGVVAADGKVRKEPVVVEQYEAGRGLITLEGPSGMFINPTSATLPKGAFTWQYCLLFPNTDTEVVAQGSMAAFGVTDWLEIGAVGNYIIVNRNELNEREFGLGGPIVRIRLLKDESWWPQLSVGGYGKYGTEILQNTTAFLAAYKRLPIDEDGFLKAIGFHAGVRSSWYHKDAPESNSVDGYCGAEFQFPGRLYLIGEIATRGKSSLGNNQRIPYAFGLQWRAGAVNISTAMMQRGNDHELGFWFGVGTALKF